MSRKSVQLERRRQIMEALHECLLEKPFDQTSIKDIAAAAKINQGLLHYYFENKEDLLLNYIEYVIQRYKALFEDWLLSKSQSLQDPQDFLRIAFDFVCHKITLNRDLSKIFIEIWGIAIYNRKVKEKLRKAYTEWIQTINTTLVKVIQDKNKSTRISIGLVAFLEGISMFSIILDKKALDPEALLKDFQEQFLQSLG